MNEIVLLLLITAAGFLLELALHSYFIKRHISGNPVLAKLTKFNETMSENLQVFLEYINFRLNLVKNGQ